MIEPTLLLNESMVKSLIDVDDVNRLVDLTFQGFGDGTVINPSKVGLDLGETGNYPYYEGFMNAMPAYVGFQDVAGQKWVGGFHGERKEAGLPYITALTFLINPHLGTFLSVMEGSHISNMRTGSQAAVALSYLIGRKNVTIGMYGAGMQARMTIRAVSRLMDIDTLYVWNHRRVTAEKFKEDMAEYVKGEIIVVDDGADAAVADALMTLTPAQEPIIKTEWVRPGTIVFPMGSFQEIEDSLILRADKIVADHVDQSLNRGALKSLYGEGRIGPEDFYATFGELSRETEPLPGLADEIVLCIPIGTGAVDVAVAAEVYKKAKASGLGTEFNFLG